jgi:hypothetical protein
MTLSADILRVKLNLGNFADPFYNVKRAERPDIQAALELCIRSGEIVPDGFGGWKLTGGEQTREEKTP